MQRFFSDFFFFFSSNDVVSRPTSVSFISIQCMVDEIYHTVLTK